MNTLLIKAIQNKEILELRYHGYSRIVEPHAYGADKHGDENSAAIKLAAEAFLMIQLIGNC